MKYLGIDYGEKRIGVALSDEGAKLAFPKYVEVAGGPERWNVVARNLKKIVDAEQVAAVVVGLPLGFSMQETESTKKARNFGEFLRKELSIEIIFQNEVLSTAEVEKSGAAREGMVDASSAALILQSFLDNKK
ncbi:MAG: Holliday junction resolvase RuvX [Patescibacteria group bacterium]